MAFFGFQLLFLPPYDRLLEIMNRGGAAMELCEHYLHYMSALCEGTMPAPPELALTADTTEERAAQLQSALKDLSVPDFVRLCAKSAGDELDEAIFDHFSEEDFSRALLQTLTAAAEPEEVEEKPPAAESTPDPDAGKHAFEVFCDCVELDEQLVAYLIDILKRRVLQALAGHDAAGPRPARISLLARPSRGLRHGRRARLRGHHGRMLCAPV